MKRKVIDYIKKKKIMVFTIIIVYIFISCLIWFVDIKPYIEVEINYGMCPKGKTAQIFYDNGKGISEKDSVSSKIVNKKVKIKLENSDKIKNIRIDPINDDSVYGIKDIKIYNYKFLKLKINSIDLEKNFEIYNSIQNEQKDGIRILFSDIGDSIFVGNEKKFKSFFDDISRTKTGNIIAYITINMLVLFVYVIFKNKNKITEFIKKNFNLFCVLSMLTVFLLMLYMSAKSEFNTHPDENVTKLGIDYYLNHWLPPDIRDTEVSNTYSMYGYTRLSEFSPYYFLAAKTGKILKNIIYFVPYYRIFNLILAITMFVIGARMIKKGCYYFVVCLGITPQLWYIFSYATSDALDYFISFLVLYLLTKKDGLIDKLINEKILFKNFWRYLFAGGLFAMILMGKGCYYPILVMAFIAFLSRLIKIDKNKKKVLVIKYITILVCCFSIFLLRYSIEIVHYDNERNNIINKMIEEHADDKFKPSINSYMGLNLRDKGINLEELFTSYHWGEISFNSLVGLYGYMEYASGDIYYNIMKIIYVIIIGYIIFISLKTKNIRIILENLAMLVLSIMLICASVYHSWCNDFQAQGRYIISIFVLMAYSVYLNEKLWNSQFLKILMIIANVLSIYSFAQYGIGQVVF